MNTLVASLQRFLFCLKTYHVRMTSYLPYKASLLSSAAGNVLLIKEGLRFHIKSGKTKGIITHIRRKSKWGVFCEIWVKLKRLLPDVQFSIYNSVRGWQTFLQEIPQQVLPKLLQLKPTISFSLYKAWVPTVSVHYEIQFFSSKYEFLRYDCFPINSFRQENFAN